MAVVNSPYIGIARGRLGEGVFSRVKGQTTVRGYNPSPANPRSGQQQSQRSQFSSAVRFFSRGVQNFFKFAFENKAEKESDYNAFMRYNYNRGMYFGPEQNAASEYPSIGNFIMTRGSLQAPSYDAANFSVLNGRIQFPTTHTGGITTLKQLSDFLIEAGYMQGDIFTFVNISTDWSAGDTSQPCVDGSQEPKWDIRQFTVDSSATETLTSLGMTANWQTGNVLSFGFSQQVATETISAVCICVSRNARSGLQVSTSVLSLNAQGVLALMFGQSSTWRQLVLEAWGSQDESILQGSRAVNYVSDFDIRIATIPSLPHKIDEGEPLSIYLSESLLIEVVAGHLKIVDEEDQEYGIFNQQGTWVVAAAQGSQNYWILVQESDYEFSVNYDSGTSPTPEDHAIVRVFWE